MLRGNRWKIILLSLNLFSWFLHCFTEQVRPLYAMSKQTKNEGQYAKRSIDEAKKKLDKVTRNTCAG